MFQRSAATVMLASLACVGVITSVASAEKGSDAAAISGIARAADQRPLIEYLVRLRSLDTGRVVATVRSSTTGEYAFRNVNSGRYAVEIVDATDKIVGTAGPFVTSATASHANAKRISVLGATAAAIAAIGANSNAGSHGSASEVATAAAVAGITGNGGIVGTKVLPSCC